MDVTCLHIFQLRLPGDGRVRYLLRPEVTDGVKRLVPFHAVMQVHPREASPYLLKPEVLRYPPDRAGRVKLAFQTDDRPPRQAAIRSLFPDWVGLADARGSFITTLTESQHFTATDLFGCIVRLVGYAQARFPAQPRAQAAWYLIAVHEPTPSEQLKRRLQMLATSNQLVSVTADQINMGWVRKTPISSLAEHMLRATKAWNIA